MTVIEVRAGEAWFCADCHFMDPIAGNWCPDCHRNPQGWYRRLYTRVGVPAADVYIATDPEYGTIRWF